MGKFGRNFYKHIFKNKANIFNKTDSNRFKQEKLMFQFISLPKNRNSAIIYTHPRQWKVG